MSIGTYRISERKCATCNWWCGKRTIEFRANKPFYVKAETVFANCSVRNAEKRTPGSNCLKWQCWTVLLNAIVWNTVKDIAKKLFS